MLPVPALPVCSCGALPYRITFVQEPLLRHGGYGHAERNTVAVCNGCWTVRVVATEATRPSLVTALG